MSLVGAGDSFLPERLFPLPAGGETTKHVIAVVRSPDMPFAVHTEAMRNLEQPSAPARDVSSRRVEFDQWRLTTVEDVNAALRIHFDGGHRPEFYRLRD